MYALGSCTEHNSWRGIQARPLPAKIEKDSTIHFHVWESTLLKYSVADMADASKIQYVLVSPPTPVTHTPCRRRLISAAESVVALDTA